MENREKKPTNNYQIALSKAQAVNRARLKETRKVSHQSLSLSNERRALGTVIFLIFIFAFTSHKII